ncbi:hypothetical protein [Rhodovibrio sodomensis]|nr:hypothetical protein [Rhodovibrio sodomensis]
MTTVLNLIEADELEVRHADAVKVACQDDLNSASKHRYEGSRIT